MPTPIKITTASEIMKGASRGDLLIRLSISHAHGLAHLLEKSRMVRFPEGDYEDQVSTMCADLAAAIRTFGPAEVNQ